MFEGIDVVVPTGARDAELLPYLLASVALFFPCYRELHAVVPIAEVFFRSPELSFSS